MTGTVIKVTKSFTFDAAHFLPNHKGKCAKMHGHTYKLEVTVVREDGKLMDSGSDEGMVIDFSDLKAIVKAEVIDKVDHNVLNEVFSFRTTAENMAAHIFDVLTDKLRPLGVKVAKIKLWETPDSCAEVDYE
ncbi:6-carboxytetrahydropterin synthase QueD [Desulfitobacterium sp.]|uniref:6-carboxytetrahydropterin synthase QueD n=1 Tax=Desulfitobacterium sp. TaxID=49981 RepID=UPI002C8E4019|nr:6-carboxytetrahydropterin synthase QueD [Desulfitobacterium sp.]HVJ50088.1 6-carboxytetrahydropterin synthase QueD [Desulfitobacterium sp.]